MARLQHHFHDAVHLVLLHHVQHMLDAARVRRHDRAVDLQVTVGNCAKDVGGVFVHKHALRALARAIVNAHDDAACAFSRHAHLLDNAARGAAGDHDALGVFRHGALPRLVSATALRGQVFENLRILLHIERERGTQKRGHQFDTAHGRRLKLLQTVQVEHGATHAVATTHGLAQLLVGNLHVEALLELLFQQLAFFVPDIGSVAAVARLRKLHNVHGLDVGKQLIHLFLAIARGFAKNHVGEIRERALVRERETVRTFDKRAEVFRQHRFGVGDGLVIHAAQANGAGAGRIDQLKRAVRAQVTAQLAAVLLVVHSVDEAGAARFVERFVNAGQVGGNRRLRGGVVHEGLYSIARLKRRNAAANTHSNRLTLREKYAQRQKRRTYNEPKYNTANNMLGAFGARAERINNVSPH